MLGLEASATGLCETKSLMLIKQLCVKMTCGTQCAIAGLHEHCSVLDLPYSTCPCMFKEKTLPCHSSAADGILPWSPPTVL